MFHSQKQEQKRQCLSDRNESKLTANSLCLSVDVIRFDKSKNIVCYSLLL